MINKIDLAPLRRRRRRADGERGARGRRGDLAAAGGQLARAGGALRVADWIRHQLDHHRDGTLRGSDDVARRPRTSTSMKTAARTPTSTDEALLHAVRDG